MDFVPNRHNKYAIRRFTVGTASILVGATLIFGVNHEAKAAETSTELTQAQADEDCSGITDQGQQEEMLTETQNTQNDYNEQQPTQQIDNDCIIDEVPMNEVEYSDDASSKAQEEDATSLENVSTDINTRNTENESVDAQSTDNCIANEQTFDNESVQEQTDNQVNNDNNIDELQKAQEYETQEENNDANQSLSESADCENGIQAGSNNYDISNKWCFRK